MKQHKKAFPGKTGTRRFSRRNKGCTSLAYVVYVLMNPKRRAAIYDTLYRAASSFAASMSEQTGKEISPTEILEEFHFRRYPRQ
ncbi:MAG: hypothetical protein IJ767_04275 [Bacteroidaceae bacterium]|nr:hypothetical protein [Bacteroidaceae bacterium]